MKDLLIRNLPDEIHEKLRKQAYESGETMAEIVRRILEKEFDNDKVMG